MANYYEIAVEIQTKADQENFRKAFDDIFELVKRMTRIPDLRNYLCPVEDDEPWGVCHEDEKGKSVTFMGEGECIIEQTDYKCQTVIYNFTKRYPTPDEIICAVLAIFCHYLPIVAIGSQTGLDEFESGLRIAQAINSSIKSPNKIYSFGNYESRLTCEAFVFNSGIKSGRSTYEDERLVKLNAYVVLKEFLLPEERCSNEPLRAASRYAASHEPNLRFLEKLNLKSEVTIKINFSVQTDAQKEAYKKAFRDILLLCQAIVNSNNPVKYWQNDPSKLWISVDNDDETRISFHSATSSVFDLFAIQNVQDISLDFNIMTVLQAHIVHGIIAILYHYFSSAILVCEDYNVMNEGWLLGSLIAKKVNPEIKDPLVYYSDEGPRSKSLCELLAEYNTDDYESTPSGSSEESDSDSEPKIKRFKNR